MASKIKVTRQKVEMLEKEGPETPLLDLSDAAVKALIRSAKKPARISPLRKGEAFASNVARFEKL